MQSKIEVSFRLFAEITWSFCAATTAELGNAGVFVLQLCSVPNTLCVLLTACPFRVVESLVQLVMDFVINCPTSWPRLLWNRAHGTQKPPSSDAEYVSHFSSSHFALNCRWQPSRKRFRKAKLLSIAPFPFFRYESLSESETPSPAPLPASKRPMSNQGT